MYGKVTFYDLAAMTEFLLGLVGKTTAVFEAYEDRSCAGRWIVEFKGGH